MPSRVFSGSVDSFGNVKWPLSKVQLQAYNAEYKWQPESRWIDFKANLWATDTISDTSSAGGFTNSARSEETTSELQLLMCTSYAVFCFKTQTTTDQYNS